MAALSVRLLGPFQVRLEGAAAVGFRSDKVRALLAYLCVEAKTPHRREKLAGLLWPDSPERTARSNLRHELANLRRVIGNHARADGREATPPFLQVSRQAVQFDAASDAWVDVTAFVDITEPLLAAPSTAEATDDEHFRQLEEAVGWYRGEFMEGFSLADSPAFEQWVLLQRESLHRLAINALQRLVEACEERGELERALKHGWRQVALDPWGEQAHRQVMRLLALSGQRSAALAQYETTRDLLADELGVLPAEETTALYERIRDGDVRPLAVASHRPPVIESQPPAFLDEERQATVVPREPFVGRDPQMARLAGFLKAALRGQGQIAFISGEAGWGKTRLLGEFSGRAQETYEHLLVVSGTCTTFTGIGDPYLPFREILRMLCADVEQDWAAGAITDQHALRLWKALPRVVDTLVAQGPHLLDTLVPGESLLERAAAHDAVEPALLERLQDLVSRGPPRSQEASFGQEHIFREVADVLELVSRNQPLLLILDDLHWADVSSIGLLFHLGRQLLDCPVLILGAYRPEDVSLGRDGKEHPLVRALDEFKRRLGDVWVPLGEDEDGGRGFVDALLDSEPNRLGDDFRDQLARSTRGHPLFTVEILRDMEEHGHIRQDESGRWVEGSAMHWDALPQRVEGVIERRIHRLDPRLREVLATGSVEGEDFTAEVVAWVCSIDEGSMVGLLSGELARTHHLVRASGFQQLGGKRISRYRFSHNLFQRYLYGTLDPVERAFLHEAIGNALETLYQGSTEEIAVHLARHFQESGRPLKALHYLKQAGDEAARVYANAEAVAHYGEAIDVAHKIEFDAEDMTLLYTRLGRTLELDSRFEQALAAYEEMEREAHQHSDRPMELTSLMARVTIQAVPTAVHDPLRAQALGEEALVLARELGDPAAEAKILWNLAVAYYLGNKLAPATECGERSLALAREHNLLEQMAQTLNDLGSFIYMYSGRLQQAKEALQEASVLWHELDNVPMLADSLASAATARVFAGEYDAAIAFSEEAHQTSRSIGNLWGQSYSLWQVGFAFWERGEVTRAIHVMDESIRLAELAGFVPPQSNTRSDLAALYGDLGGVARGLEMAHVALSSGEELGYLADRAKILGTLAHLHLLKGDVAEAEARLAQAKMDPYRDAWPVLSVMASLAEGELALEQEAFGRCLAVMDTLLADLRQWGMRSHVSHALYLQGLALQGWGRDGAARARFLEARAEAEAVGSRRILWRILHALSQLEEARTEAERLRQEAREIVRYIVDHIDQTDLRASFLSLPGVRAVLRPVESN